MTKDIVVINKPEVHVDLAKTEQAVPKILFFFCMLKGALIVPPQYEVNENFCNFFSIPSILFLLCIISTVIIILFHRSWGVYSGRLFNGPA